MRYLERLELVNFKGIGELSCEFDGLTVLAGLNNSGKTSVLQAAYLLTTLLPDIARHQNLDNTNERTRRVSLPLGPLSIPGWDWVAPASEAPWMIRGRWRNGVVVELKTLGRGEFIFGLEIDGRALRRAEDRALLEELEAASADFFRPPGMLGASEPMMHGGQYRQELGHGRSAQYFRNGIWWAIQTGSGFEGFADVQREVAARFPGIDLMQPTLGGEGNPPPILLRYKERGGDLLDIAQSGAGLHTYLALAQILRQSSGQLILLDEPDTHLHAAQQTMVMKQLLEVADGQDRQVVVATHSGEMLSAVPDESVRWLERGVIEAHGGVARAELLERLGVKAQDALVPEELPAVVVYVEGQTDKRLLEQLVEWARSQVDGLPSVRVVHHRDGRFGAPTLQGIARTVRSLRPDARVVGVRDLDWDYREIAELPPPPEPMIREDEGWTLITLPCKELENALCGEAVLRRAVTGQLSGDDLIRMLNEEARREGLIGELRYALLPQLRDRQPAGSAPATRERVAEQEFERWLGDDELVRRLVSGKGLLRGMRRRLQKKGLRIPLANQFAGAGALPAPWDAVAGAVFPGVEWPPQAGDAIERDAPD